MKRVGTRKPGQPFTASEDLSELHGIDRCPECHCPTGDDTDYKDFSNKNIVVCAQCGYEWHLDILHDFTDEQLERQEWVDNNISGLLDELAGLKVTDAVLPWDIELIDLVRDACKNVIVDKLQLMTEMEFYPYIEKGEV